MVGTLQRFAHPFQARHVINTNRSKMATAANAAFVNCVCPHEMAVYTNTRTVESFYLVSVPDLRSDRARILFLLTVGASNLCQPRCFCTGHFLAGVDVLFPDEGQQVQLLFADAYDQGSEFHGGALYRADVCTPSTGRTLETACGQPAGRVVELLTELVGSDAWERYSTALQQARDPEGLGDNVSSEPTPAFPAEVSAARYKTRQSITQLLPENPARVNVSRSQVRAYMSIHAQHVLRVAAYHR